MQCRDDIFGRLHIRHRLGHAPAGPAALRWRTVGSSKRSVARREAKDAVFLAVGDEPVCAILCQIHGEAEIVDALRKIVRVLLTWVHGNYPVLAGHAGTVIFRGTVTKSEAFNSRSSPSSVDRA